MGIKKRSVNEKRDYSDYSHLKQTVNTSSPQNYTQISNTPNNGNLTRITLEDCDRAVYEFFNNRFKIRNNFQPLIVLDTEMVSLREMNLGQYDEDKKFLNGPFFTITRTGEKNKYKVNPASKTIISSVPKFKTSEGIIIEDTIAEAAIWYDISYELNFISVYRGVTNEFVEQFRTLFRNKRTLININSETFSIGPQDYNDMTVTSIENRENIQDKTFYTTKINLVLECFLRNSDSVLKRERINKFKIDFTVLDGKNKIQLDSVEKNKLTLPKKNDP